MVSLRLAAAAVLGSSILFCGQPQAQSQEAAKAAAAERLKTQLAAVAAPKGDLIAKAFPQGSRASSAPSDKAPAAVDTVVPRPKPAILTAATPRPRPGAAEPSAAVADPVADRLALGFAAIPTDASPSQETASATDATMALAYAAEPEDAQPTRALNAIEALVQRHAESHDIPPELAHALVQVESSYRPKATGRNGEIGLMQITPKTARAIGYTGSPKALYDPEVNLTWGMKYLAKARKLAGGDLCGTLVRYNSGLDAKPRKGAATKFCAKVKSAMTKA